MGADGPDWEVFIPTPIDRLEEHIEERIRKRFGEVYPLDFEDAGLDDEDFVIEPN